MLVGCVLQVDGHVARYPRFHIFTMADGGTFHVKDHEGFHHMWAFNSWEAAWTEEESDPDE